MIWAFALHSRVFELFVEESSVAIESTAEFETYIRELAAGTIWPDE
ncbi:MAG TPA: hypothetical protein VGY48_18695 [Vicinamibacterales bacterium]|nr:hypothetical protein [Vicinamibacterales bacterium]